MKKLLHKTLTAILISLLSAVSIQCTPKNWEWDSSQILPDSISENTKIFLQKISTTNLYSSATKLSILLPYNGTVFPPEIAAPEIVWQDDNPGSEGWFLIFSFKNRQPPLYACSSKTKYVPNKSLWETIKANSVSASATISIYGFNNKSSQLAITSFSSIKISTSTDPVDGTILYRQVPLPFQVGAENFKKIQWRLGDISSYTEPPVILKNLTTCANCHQGSRDGSLLSMELNYKGDSGAQFISQVNENMLISAKDFMTWSDFPKTVVLPPTRGLFAKLSPSGKYLASTVNEISYAAVTNSAEYSQLFFPTYGVLAWYSTKTKESRLLPGADDLDYIQTDPAWDSSEQTIAFARSETMNRYHKNVFRIATNFENKNIHELNKLFPIKFDLYTIPFNAGSGGIATPLAGASKNDKSNYFARYSPDGKWIVFTQSETGIMLQPDSELYIISVKGGHARKMNCNRKYFNSWHSFSPNGKWMLFSSKARSEYTEIFLTHIDKNGVDSPPVLLSRLSNENFAANLPEFLNIRPNAIKNIHVTDYN